MPSAASSPSSSSSGFDTLQREDAFRNPSKTGNEVPILQELVAPHIESFNALFDDSNLTLEDGDGKGLLSLAIKEIGSKVIFDGAGIAGEASGAAGWGNRLSSTFLLNDSRLAFANVWDSTHKRYCSWQTYGI